MIGYVSWTEICLHRLLVPRKFLSQQISLPLFLLPLLLDLVEERKVEWMLLMSLVHMQEKSVNGTHNSNDHDLATVKIFSGSFDQNCGHR